VSSDGNKPEDLGADNLTPEQRKRTMRSVHSKNSKPEMLVRRIAYGMGFRYRLHRMDLPGNPDLVFASRKKIIFVHGCFWHGHDCPSGRKRPKANQDYWGPKLAKNKARDARNLEMLRRGGWNVLVLWECELKDVQAASDRIRSFLL
jgi:DNA mismatch endonuclease (patch repair protein)